MAVKKFISEDDKGQYVKVYPLSLDETQKDRIAKYMKILSDDHDALEEKRKKIAKEFAAKIETEEEQLKLLIKINELKKRPFASKVQVKIVNYQDTKEIHYYNEFGEMVYRKEIEKGKEIPLIFDDDEYPDPIYLDPDCTVTLDPLPEKDKK